MDIDIGEELFGFANWLNLFINNRVMALDCSEKCVFPAQYLQKKLVNFDKILYIC